MKYSRVSSRPPKCCPQPDQMTSNKAEKMPAQNGQRFFERLSAKNPRTKQTTLAVRCLSVDVESESSTDRAVATTCQTHQASSTQISQEPLVLLHRPATSPKIPNAANPVYAREIGQG